MCCQTFGLLHPEVGSVLGHHKIVCPGNAGEITVFHEAKYRVQC